MAAVDRYVGVLEERLGALVDERNNLRRECEGYKNRIRGLEDHLDSNGERYRVRIEALESTLQRERSVFAGVQRQLKAADELNGELLVAIADMRAVVDRGASKSNTVTVQLKLDTDEFEAKLTEIAASVERAVKPIYILGVDLA